MTAGPFNVSYVPKQANGLLQSRKPVWKSTSPRNPECIHVALQFDLLQRAWARDFHRVIVDPNDSRRSSASRVVCWGQAVLWHREVGIAINSGRTPAVLRREGIWLMRG